MKILHLGLCDYLPVYQAMERFTFERDKETEDELWVLEHPPVFTQGMAGKSEHVLNSHGIPIVQTDRGGQVTYHGPGQLIIYTLIDFNQRKIGVRHLVSLLEGAIIGTLAHYGISAVADVERPGVYVAGKKIASLGLRIRKGAVYHGLALNVDMDLAPFSYINPCGYVGLEMTQMADLMAQKPELTKVAEVLVANLRRALPEVKK